MKFDEILEEEHTQDLIKVRRTKRSWVGLTWGIVIAVIFMTVWFFHYGKDWAQDTIYQKGHGEGYEQGGQEVAQVFQTALKQAKIRIKGDTVWMNMGDIGTAWWVVTKEEE